MVLANLYRSARKPRAASRGQAMVEFIAMSAALLVPLFVVVPLLGKFADLNFQTQMAGRYVTWERTVWFEGNGSNKNVPEELDEDGSVATRTDETIARSAQNRFFRNVGTNISRDDFGSLTAANVNVAWNLQGGGNLFSTASGDGIGNPTSMGTEPRSVGDVAMAYKGLELLNDITGFFSSALTSLTDFLGIDLGLDRYWMSNPMFDKKGYFKPVVKVTVNNDPDSYGPFESWLLFDADGAPLMGDVNFIYPGAIVANGWNAQSMKHFEETVDNYVGTNLVLENNVMDFIVDVVGVVEDFYLFLGGSSDPGFPSSANAFFGAGGLPVYDPADEVSCTEGRCTYD